MMKSKKQKITKLNLDEELLREAAEIEEEIKNVPLEENPVDKERLRAAILMQVLQEERKKQQKRSARRRVAQGAAVFAVTLTGIFGLSMTSQANRIFLVEKVEEFFSGSTDVNVDNSEEAILRIYRSSRPGMTLNRRWGWRCRSFFMFRKVLPFPDIRFIKM